MNEKYSQNQEQPPPPYPQEPQFSQYPQQQVQNHQPILINVPALHIANNSNCKLNKSNK